MKEGRRRGEEERGQEKEERREENEETRRREEEEKRRKVGTYLTFNTVRTTRNTSHVGRLVLSWYPPNCLSLHLSAMT